MIMLIDVTKMTLLGGALRAWSQLQLYERFLFSEKFEHCLLLAVQLSFTLSMLGVSVTSSSTSVKHNKCK